MSRVEHYSGTLKLVERLTDETIEDQCKRILKNVELEDYDSYEKMLLSETDDEYIVNQGVLYSVIRKELDPDESLFRISKGQNGEITFEVKYYNGGCSFDEALEYAFKAAE